MVLAVPQPATRSPLQRNDKIYDYFEEYLLTRSVNIFPDQSVF